MHFGIRRIDLDDRREIGMTQHVAFDTRAEARAFGLRIA
ncbi:hypothetical protein ABIC50_003090 [Burkholderia sp. 567]